MSLAASSTSDASNFIAEKEALERERIQQEKDAASKLAADRHKEHADALAAIKKQLVSRKMQGAIARD